MVVSRHLSSRFMFVCTGVSSDGNDKTKEACRCIAAPACHVVAEERD